MILRKKNLLLAAFLAIPAGVAGWLYFLQVSQPTNRPAFRHQQESEITPFDTPTDLPPTPTETLLPTPELPTPETTRSSQVAWTGLPAYAESLPGYLFQVEYDTALWSLIPDETGALALFNRNIPYCKIVPTAGRGLPRNLVKVDDQFRDIGSLRYEVVTISQNGSIKYVNYFGGDEVILTGFQVSFEERMEECLQQSELVFATLGSVAASTPTASQSETPTFTSPPTATGTP